jgi:hypothetical protein
MFQANRSRPRPKVKVSFHSTRPGKNDVSAKDGSQTEVWAQCHVPSRMLKMALRQKYGLSVMFQVAYVKALQTGQLI